MSAELAIPTKELLSSLREMVRQWRHNGSNLSKNAILNSSGSSHIAPIVQAIEVTSSTADAYGYPARIQTYNGTAWSDTYAECRAVQIGSTIAGAVLATGFYPLGRLMTVAGGYHVYGVHPGASALATIEEVDGSPSVTNATKLQLPNSAMSNPSAGVARLLEASSTTGGTVTLNDQQLGIGTKTVVGLIVAPHASDAGYGAKFFHDPISITYGADGLSITDQLGTSGTLLIFRYNGGLSFGNWNDSSGFYLANEGASGTEGRMYLLDSLTPSNRIITVSNYGSEAGYFCTSTGFAIGVAGTGTAALGLTGTLGPGCASTGGIVTNIGSGSFGDVIASAADITGSFALSGDITPSQLVANTNDWNPTGW